MFKEDGASSNTHEEMDIDEILKRAETRETEEPQNAHTEFLGQFKVADFGLPEWDE